MPSRQVMIEVTIAEVKLTDELSSASTGCSRAARRRAGAAAASSPAAARSIRRCRCRHRRPAPIASGLAVAAQGFSYLINNANFPGGVQAALHLLDTYGNTKVIANPHIAALDNQKATIKAGNRIPVNQQTIVGSTTNAVTTTSQYIDTGVLLQVTPHINAGGLVTLDVQAEVSSPGNAADRRRRAADQHALGADAAVGAVRPDDGDGRADQETKRNSRQGPAVAHRIPILGGLFGNQTLKNDRTELVLFITPRVVNDSVDLLARRSRICAKDGTTRQRFPAQSANKVSGNPDN